MIDERQISKAVVYLRIVFWGWVLHVVVSTAALFVNAPRMWGHGALTLGGNLRFDAMFTILYGPGFLVVFVGLASLALVRVNWRYAFLMSTAVFAHVTSGRCFLVMTKSSYDLAIPFGYQWRLLYRPLGLLIVLGVPAMMLACLAMRSMCRQLRLAKSDARWAQSAIYFPIVGLSLVALSTTVFATLANSAHICHGWYPFWWLFLIVKLLAYCPLVYFYWITSRMKREAPGAEGETYSMQPTSREAAIRS